MWGGKARVEKEWGEFAEEGGGARSRNRFVISLLEIIACLTARFYLSRAAFFMSSDLSTWRELWQSDVQYCCVVGCHLWCKCRTSLFLPASFLACHTQFCRKHTKLWAYVICNDLVYKLNAKLCTFQLVLCLDVTYTLPLYLKRLLTSVF